MQEYRDTWDGRWLAWIWHRPTTAADPGRYVAQLVERAATHYEAALLARDYQSLAPGALIMVTALPEAKPSLKAVPSTVAAEIPGPRWFTISGNAQRLPTQLSEHTWLSYVSEQFAPLPTPAAK